MRQDGRDLLSDLPGESDLEWEHRMDALADHAAVLLLETCGRLGWGSGLALSDARSRLDRVGRQLGYPDYTERVQGARPARKAMSSGTARRVWDRDGWECQLCGSHRDLTVDHKIPLAAGGTDDFGNLQTLCKSCNSRKGARV